MAFGFIKKIFTFGKDTAAEPETEAPLAEPQVVVSALRSVSARAASSVAESSACAIGRQRGAGHASEVTRPIRTRGRIPRSLSRTHGGERLRTPGSGGFELRLLTSVNASPTASWA